MNVQDLHPHARLKYTFEFSILETHIPAEIRLMLTSNIRALCTESEAFVVFRRDAGNACNLAHVLVVFSR